MREMPHHRANEQIALKHIEKWLDLTGSKLAMSQGIDFAMLDTFGSIHEVRALVEFKLWPHKNIQDCNGFVFLNVSKVTAMQALPMVYKKYIVYGFKDGGLYIYNVDDIDEECFISVAPNLASGKIDYDLVIEIPCFALKRFAQHCGRWYTKEDFKGDQMVKGVDIYA